MNTATAIVLLTAAFLGLIHGAAVRHDIITDPVRNVTLRKLDKPASLGRAAVSDYYISDYITSYFEAVDTCLDYELQPVMVKTPAKHDEVARVLAANDVRVPVYIGLTDVLEDGKWKWFDGSSLSPVLRKWAVGMGGTGPRQCVTMMGNGYLFNEAQCGITSSHDPMRFACEPQGN